MISQHVWESWRPPVRPLATQWIPSNVYMPLEAEYNGLFDFDLAPHTRGVLEAWDDETIRQIYLCWATRNMKTSLMISIMLCAAANYPAPMGYGSCDEMSVDRSIDEQVYPMLRRCKATVRKLPPLARQGRDNIRLQDCRIRKAFGGSPASVAGWPAKYIFVNEADKWPRRASSEADAVRGFTNRVRGFPYDSKIVIESTPGELETSRIWAYLTAKGTDQRRYHVPCPYCGHWQTLDFGDRDSPHGIKWEHPKNGHSDPIQAEETAYYRCPHKGCQIRNPDRASMLQAGLWLSEGQHVNKHGKIAGKRVVNSPNVGFGPLGSEYSLLISGWGQLAREFLACNGEPGKLQDFENSVRALPWDPRPDQVKPHELAERLCTDSPLGLCPEWAVFLSRGCDVQENGNVIKWKVIAWGPKGRSATIDYGVCRSQKEYENVHRSAIYRHADGGQPLSVLCTLMDSGDGNVTEDIYRLCRKLHRCYPCKGASSKLEKAFKPSDLHDSEGIPVKLILVNSDRSQYWIESHLRGYAKSAPFTLPNEARFDTDFLEELLAEVKIGKVWVKTGAKINDYRDCTRYAWCAAMMVTDDGAAFDHMQRRAVPA